MSALYNHSRHFLAEQYAGDPVKQADTLYAGGLDGIRALPCTTPDDVIQLDPRLRRDYDVIRDHLGEIGLSVTSQIIWNTDVSIAQDHPDRELSVYAYAEAVHAVRPDAKRLGAVDMFDDKNRFIQYCRDNGYPVPRTLIVDNVDMPDFTKLKLPLYVKAARSSSGSNIFKCTSYEEVLESINLMGPKYQIQEEVPDVRAFLNVQYESSGEIANHVATTSQLLDGFSHAGNQYPSEHDPRDVTDPLANELVKLGLRDIFAFDVAVTPLGMVIIECNARWNGSSYPTKAAQRLEVPKWTAVSLTTSLQGPEDIRLGNLAYDKTSKFGIAILSSSLRTDQRKVSMLLAGNREEQGVLRTALRKIL